MKMEVHLQHRLEQRLQLSQQMLQNLELLQKPILELRQAIDEELQANPTLEIATELEERPAEAPTAEKPAAPETATEEGQREFLESIEDEWLQSERRGHSSGSTSEDA